jgi:hypothetical protein
VAVPSKVLVRLGNADPTEVRARRDDHRTGNHRSPALLRGRVARAGRLAQGTVARPRPLHNRRRRPNAFPRSRRRWTAAGDHRVPGQPAWSRLEAAAGWIGSGTGAPVAKAPRFLLAAARDARRECLAFVRVEGEPPEPRRRERRAGGLPTGLRTEASHAKPDDWQRIRRQGE